MERGAKKKDYASFYAANKRFHLSIVKATRNNSLINCIKSLLNLFSNSDMGLELRKRYLTEEKYVWNAVEIHRSILENLQNRNAEKLRDAYIEHFVQVEEQLIGR